MKQYILFSFILLGIYSCNSGNTIPTDAIKVNLAPVRFDQLVFKMDTNNIPAGIQQLEKQHPVFTELYLNHLIGLAPNTDTSKVAFEGLRHFLTYKDYTNLYKTVQQKFPDTKEHDKALTKLVQHIKYYWKDYKAPKLYYFISGLNNYNAVTIDTLVGIGLDMYLGKDFEFYPAVQLPQYQINKCEPEYIPVNAAFNIYESRYAFEPEGKNLLALLIEKGKEMYFVDKVLPDIDMTKKLGYTKEQMTWVEKNEGAVWNYFISQNLLYNQELTKIMPIIVEGPTTPNFPPESPGALGNYIGYQIVKKYAENEKLDVAQVCALQEAPQLILQRSKYKPR